MFIESFDYKYYILHEDKFYNAIELVVEQHTINEDKKEKNVYRPPASHPFKAASYQRYIEKHNLKKKSN